MARKKSYRDIWQQRNRIVEEIARRARVGYPTEREKKLFDRVERAASRYMQNIAKSKSAQRAERNLGNKVVITYDDLENLRKKITTRKYSRNIYMGLTNG